MGNNNCCLKNSDESHDEQDNFFRAPSNLSFNINRIRAVRVKVPCCSARDSLNSDKENEESK